MSKIKLNKFLSRMRFTVDKSKSLNKKVKFKSFVSVVILLFMSSFAHADLLGIFIEPMVTYQKADATVNWQAPLESSSSTITGSGVGLRLGYHALDVLFLALDARYAQPEWKNSTDDLASKVTDINYGATVGFQPPILPLRFWGTYVLGGSLDPLESRGFDTRFTKAQGYRLGAGMQILLISLNLEYQELKHSGLEIENAGPFTGIGAGTTEMNSKAWIVSASLPLSF